MAKRNNSEKANSKLWVQIMCGVLAALMVLGTIVLLVSYLL